MAKFSADCPLVAPIVPGINPDSIPNQSGNCLKVSIPRAKKNFQRPAGLKPGTRRKARKQRPKMNFRENGKKLKKCLTFGFQFPKIVLSAEKGRRKTQSKEIENG
jgi:hypothetical protein